MSRKRPTGRSRSAPLVGCRRPALGLWRREEGSGRTAHVPCGEQALAGCDLNHIFR